MSSIIATMITFVVFFSTLWTSFQAIESIGHVVVRIQDQRSRVVHYDEVLTMSANMFAVTGDPKWKKRYLEYEPKLDQAIAELKKLSPDVFTQQASRKTDEANLKLVEIEHISFTLVSLGNRQEAMATLNSPEYLQLKNAYSEGMRNIEKHLEQHIEELFSRQKRHTTLAYSIIALAIPFLALIYFFSFRLTKRHFEDQQKSNEIIKGNERFLDAIVENIPDIIVVKDAENLRFVRLNRAGENFLGYSREELIGKSDHDILSKNEADSFAQRDRDALQKKALVDIQSETVHTKNLGKRILHTKKIPVLDQENNPEYLLGISEDITERIQSAEAQEELKRKLHRAERMEAIGLMAGGVAHDLNNILSGIVNYPEILLLNLPDDSALRQPLEAIHQSGLRVAAVVSDLLTVARGAACVKESCSLNDIVEEYLESPEFRNLKTSNPKITFAQKLEAEYPFSLCSPVHIKKALMNLVMNGAESIEETAAGKITIFTSDTYLDQTESARMELAEGRYILLGVRDTGTGISSADLPHIFEPFYTRKAMQKSGTGLGLSVVWNAMKDHGGGVSVESHGEGTVFALYFPYHGEFIQSRDTENETATMRGNGERILVIDDEQLIQHLACEMLSHLGYRPEAVSSGERAIEYVKKQPVDLLLIDMLMGTGINGYKTYKEIVKIYPEQKAVIASGYSASEDVQKALELGAAQFISKPYRIETLARAVGNALVR